MKSLIILSCLLVSALAFDLDTEWRLWKAEHGKLYASEHEDLRKSVFGDNLEFIQRHNKLYEQGKKTYRVALNKFADLTQNEFNQMMKGSIPTNFEKKNLFEFNASKPIAATVDWRTKNVVTPVKDQGACGSCWAFSATGSLEAAHALKTGKLVSLSEQNLVDCDHHDSGCFGGLMDRAFTYIQENGGIDTENSYPYHARRGSCRFNSSNVGATLASYKDIEHGSEQALAQAVNDIGPISVAIWADFRGFRFYHSGVLIAGDYDCPEGQLDHGVLAVGYGTLNGVDYWLVKNSWGTSWGGLGGYVLMARNHENMCGIASLASYPVV